MKTIAFIPLRGGSVSIPLKNIKLLNDRPLAYYVIDAAVECKQIDEVYIATDSDEIKRVIEAYPSNKVKVVGRSPEVSTNTASTESVMLEVLENIDFDTVVLIQATSPLLTAKDLEAGLNELNKGYDSVLSVVRQHRFIWDEKTKAPINYDFLKRPLRQEWDGILVENGAFYITTKQALFSALCRISGMIGFSEMPPETYVELDEYYDWDYIEMVFQKRKNK